MFILFRENEVEIKYYLVYVDVLLSVYLIIDFLWRNYFFFCGIFMVSIQISLFLFLFFCYYFLECCKFLYLI